MAGLKRITKSFGCALLAALLATVSAQAAPRTARIHYAERVSLAGIPGVAGADALRPATPVRTSFEAYGRHFELRLEPNDRVLRKLSSAQRNALPAHALYAGSLAGLPGSWVRITRLEDGLRGLIYDGSELYVVAPASSVASELDTAVPGATGGSTLVFRAADTDSGLGPDFCKVLTPGAGASPITRSTQGPDYKAVFAELQSFAPEIAAALPTRELDLALVADRQFSTQFANPTGEMLARLNNVDGIFSGQVGVKVVSGFVNALASDSGLTSTVPETLLDQFESYRKATPEAASRGLAHLMTSRELDGTTVGIAYMSTLCSPQFAVSLSQTYIDTFYSSLVAAHEIGHNFGAPHDGVSGACSATPQTFLMSPFINGSSSFSACSLAQMSPVVSAASCLTAAKSVDVAVDIAGASFSGYVRQDVHVPVSVTSSGTIAADSVVLRLTRNALMSISSATVAGGACTASGLDVTCQLGAMAIGEVRQVDVIVTDATVESAGLTATVSAAGDGDPGNNADSATIRFISPADGSISVSPSWVEAFVGQALSFSVTAANSGPLALQDAVVSVPVPAPFTVNSASGTGLNCTMANAEIRCAIGSLPAGESRRIDVTVSASSAARESLTASLQSSNDAHSANDSGSVTLTAAPLVEMVLEGYTVPDVIPVSNTVTQSFFLQSTGPQPATGASFQLSIGPGVEITGIAGTGAQCGPTDATTYRCTYANPIESGGSRRLDATLRGKTVGFVQGVASVTAPDSQHLPGGTADTVSLGYQVKALVDVAVVAPASQGAFDHRPTVLSFQVNSSGATPASGTRFTLTLPAGVRALSSQSTLGSCSFTSSSVSCAIGLLASGGSARVQVGLQSDVPGTYTLASQATADGDVDATDDAATTSLTVRPNIDVSVAAAPANPHVRIGATLDYVVTLAAATQPVTGVAAEVVFGPGIAVVGATAAQGDCSESPASVSCNIGTIAANGSTTLTLRLRGDTVGQTLASITATAAGDIDSSNSSRSDLIAVDARGDVAVLRPAAAPGVTVGTTFNLPDIVIEAIAPTDDVRATVTLPSAFSIVSATAGGAPCSVDAGTVTCSFGTLPAGAQRVILVQLRPNRSGAFTVAIQANADDDADTSNNDRTIPVTVSAASSTSGGSGGGGGALDPATLLLLMLAPVALRRRGLH